MRHGSLLRFVFSLFPFFAFPNSGIFPKSGFFFLHVQSCHSRLFLQFLAGPLSRQLVVASIPRGEKVARRICFPHSVLKQ